MVQTKTPQLDSFMKEELSSTAKAEDKELAKTQTFVLDALAPLTAVLEASGANEGANELSVDEVVNATTAAVALIGNASANITHLRRKKAIHSFNKELASLVSDDKEFKEAAPALFGTEFPKRAKERTEQVKAMRSSLTPRRGQKSFFRGGPSARRGGGGGLSPRELPPRELPPRRLPTGRAEVRSGRSPPVPDQRLPGSEARDSPKAKNKFYPHKKILLSTWGWIQ